MKHPAGSALAVSLAFASNRSVPVGRLALDRGRAVLEYHPDFAASNLTLNPRFARPGRDLVWAQEPRAFDGLHGVFADSLPDAWGCELMRRHARATGIDANALTGLDQLAIVGRRGMGALVYEPAFPALEDSEIDLDTLSRRALDVLAGRDHIDALATLEHLGESSGGARPKILVARDAAGKLRAGDGAIPFGFEAWIVKFRGARDRVDSGALEAAYADMARAAGIDISTTALLPSRAGKLEYFATKRFDRGPEGMRLHVISVAALLETPWDIPSLDYHGLLNAVRFVTRRQSDVEQMFRRMVFNIAAHNRDDHTKQHAFLMDSSGRWSLAPAYDLTFSAGPGGEHYLSVEGHGSAISRRDVDALAIRQSIGTGTTSGIIDDVSHAVAGFAKFAAAYDVSRATRSEVAKVLAHQLRALDSKTR